MTNRMLLVVGVLIAASACTGSAAEPLFSQPQDVPSAVDAAPARQYADAAERAAQLVRAAVVEHDLPGVSVAVGIAGLAKEAPPSEALAKAGGTIVWAEGFGWRDVETQTPVTPRTRFNIGTAAAAVTAAAAARLGLTSTGAESVKVWSPEAIGEPAEDFPPFTLIRHVVFQQTDYPLPGDRATFYVPLPDDNPPRPVDLAHRLSGQRLMSMHDLACCDGEMVVYSTPSDLVRFALATNAETVNGQLAGGSVMSLLARPDTGIVVVVSSNIAQANTAALARTVADAFAGNR